MIVLGISATTRPSSQSSNDEAGVEMSSESQGDATKEEILTIDTVASELHCSKAHVCKTVRGLVPGVPSLPAIRMGRRILVRRSSLERWKINAEGSWVSDIVPTSPEVDAGRRMKGKKEHA